MPRTVLLVIDAQQSFEHRPYWNTNQVAPWQPCQSALITHARNALWPVVFVYHNEDAGPFAPNSGLVAPLAFVDRREGDPVFHKHVHNALTDSGLAEWLTEHEIERVLISGIRTEQCCETTARVASDFGYDVEFVMDATLTFDMTHPQTGETVPADEIRSRVALVLADRFARITRTTDYSDTSRSN